MILSDAEVARLRRLLWEIDKGLEKTRYKPYVETRTRNIRLIMTRAERREKRAAICPWRGGTPAIGIESPERCRIVGRPSFAS